MNGGIADTFGQLGPRLPDDGGSFEADYLDIGMLVQLHSNVAVAVARGGVQPLHSADTRQHGFQLAGHFHLHHPRRSARHAETHREAGQAA